MASVILDDVLSDKLQGGKQSVEVLDAAGQVVGHYLTHAEYMRLRADADFDKPLDPAERDEAIRDMLAGRLRTSEDLRAEFDRIRQTTPRGPS